MSDFTILLKAIFPDSQVFAQSVADYLKRTPTEEDRIAYDILFNTFCNSSIAYDTVEAFKRHFMVTYRNVTDRFNYRQKIAELLKDLSPEDLAVVQSSISNTSYNNAEYNVYSLDNPVEYVNDQVASKTKANVLDSYNKAMYTISDRMIEEYIDEFRRHFLCVFPAVNYIIRR